MSDFGRLIADLPLDQQAIHAKCFHPSGVFTEFSKDEVEQSIPERFEKIVRMYPDRIAVKTRNRTVTYDGLNKMANRVARAILAQCGRGAEPVALLSATDVPLFSAMVGILKAGKFFVLMDPSFPGTRIAAVLKDCQARLIVTDQEHFSLASALVEHGNEVLNVDTLDLRLSNQNVSLSLTPRSLATIIYTSGSTGKPKGAIQDHRSMLHYTMVRTNALHICKHDRFCLLPSGTAGSMFITFAALLTGAALLPFNIQVEGVTHLATWLVQEEITVCYIASPLFRRFGETLTGKQSFPKLRLIRLASEAARRSDVDVYRKVFSPDCLLANALSSTETGILTKYLIDRETVMAGSDVPVGYPMEDKEILLLDDSGHEVGFNKVGEIAVRSRYLSLGYWRRPELTKAKFKADPEGGEKRLYFTGDLGLRLPDGCLIHKGRKDLRVKVRGYGVEVAEVEKVLREHAAVKEAVVAARKDESGENRLVAYLTSLELAGPSVSELRGFLKNKVPDHMIPSAFVTLDAIPLTPNGKVDRQALPNPGHHRPELKTPFVFPRTPTEQQLAQIWAEVLALDQVGIHDSFFDLGGHSLSATRVVSRVIKTFGLELSLQSLFRSPTVAGMAAVITESRTKKPCEGELQCILAELESMSDEEAARLLSTSAS